MKTKILSIIIGILVIGIASCDKDFLEEEVFDALAPSNFYNSEVDAHAALMAAYDAFQSSQYYGLNMITIAEMPTNVLSTRWGDPADNFTEDSQNSWRLEWMWNQVWVANNRINSVLEYIPPIDMDEDDKDIILGEAYFLRALNYFNIVRIWENVPKIDKPTTSLEGLEYVQVPPDTIYNFIIADLMRAESRLPVKHSEDQTGRATLGAAKSLLGKVYLTLGQWQSAKDKLEEVINMGKYDLFDDYADVFGGRDDYTEGYTGPNNLTENGITNWLSIINQDNKNIEVFHPNNRQAFTFIVLDNYGNIIQPTGYAKVDPPAEQVLTISNDSAYNYTIKPISDFYFPYLSGTAQFGYKLEKNKKYKMHIIYRPFGGTYGSISSEEKEVRIY